MTDGEVIGRGKVAEVVVRGPHVLKAYFDPAAKREVFREAAILSAIETFDLPTPRAIEAGQYDGRWGLVMTRAPGKPFLEAMLADPAAVPAHIAAMVRLHRSIHSHVIPMLPPHKAKLADALGRAARLSDAHRGKLLDALDTLPTGRTLCHLDYHPLNIIGTPDDAMVIDWLDASAGDPAADVCRTLVLLTPHVPEIAELYLATYVVASGLSPDAVLAWRPVIAGARLAEGVPEEDYLMSLVEEA
jgi:aminoglycoside phosphotransferase (APT) family kinase protein